MTTTIQLTATKKPIFCDECASVNVSVDQQVCLSCGAAL